MFTKLEYYYYFLPPWYVLEKHKISCQVTKHSLQLFHSSILGKTGRQQIWPLLNLPKRLLQGFPIIRDGKSAMYFYARGRGMHNQGHLPFRRMGELGDSGACNGSHIYLFTSFSTNIYTLYGQKSVGTSPKCIKVNTSVQSPNTGIILGCTKELSDFKTRFIQYIFSLDFSLHWIFAAYFSFFLTCLLPSLRMRIIPFHSDIVSTVRKRHVN